MIDHTSFGPGSRTYSSPPAPRPFRFGDILRYRAAGPLESADERFLFIGTVDGYPRTLKGVIVIVFSSGGWIRIDGYEDQMEVVS